MNSEPIRLSGARLEASTPIISTMTSQRSRTAPATSGRYTKRSNRDTGLRRSDTIRPRTSQNMSTGTTVTATTDAIAMEYVLVSASGLNNRPSWASSVKTGRKETVMTSRLKNSVGPTSWAARRTISKWDRFPLCAARCRWTFSTMTIEASTSTPIEIAMPPSDMMFEPSPWARITTKASRTDTGIARIGTSADRKWNRKTRHTTATTIDSSSRVSVSVSMERSISPLRS